MKYWFLEDLSRLSKEKKEIQNLYSKVDWLEEIEWILESSLALIARIKAHGHIYDVKLSYHAYFPSTPPTVISLDEEINWSEHQYVSGTLCLEWGPDNWHPSITGAQMLESTYKLIYSENPYGNNKQKEIIPSRHFLTQGQELRNKYIRLYAGQELLEHLTKLQLNEVYNIHYTILVENETVILHVLELRSFESILWTNNDFPTHLKSKEPKIGIVLNTDLTEKEVKSLKTFSEVEALYEKQSLEELSSAKFVILLDNIGNALTLFGSSEDKDLSIMPLISDESDKKRLPSVLETLKGKKVGIVGLGSLGSKISISLGRMGVENFYLIDDDIFMSGNIERHTLDWKSVGSHKVDAIKSQLLNLSAQIKVQVSRTNISGQEATSTLDSVLLSLGECDLIVDATANPKVFNYLSAVNTINRIPMVWGEVFAGGIGGLIARSRPELDPSPLTMRALLNGYTQELPEFKYKINNEPYLAEIDEEQVMIASDADVSVIASHLSRFATDSLVKGADSIFPYSMYLIGMSNSWIFEAPFDTRPINTSILIEKESVTPRLEGEEGTIDFLQSLLEEKNDKDNPS